MSNRDTVSFKKYKEEAKPLILELIEEYSFLSRRSLQVAMELEGYWHTVVWNAIMDLENEGAIRTAKYPPQGRYPVWVYDEGLRIRDLRAVLNREYIPLYNRFVKQSKKMGHHCETVIEKALNEAGFVTVSRFNETKYFRGRTYPGRGRLDFIAMNDGIFYGIEVKNYISYPRIEKIMEKKKVADFHEIQFMIISRALGSYSFECHKKKILYMEFEKLIWSPKYSSFAKKMAQKFLFPIYCIDKPTEDMISKLEEIPKLREKHFSK